MTAPERLLRKNPVQPHVRPCSLWSKIITKQNYKYGSHANYKLKHFVKVRSQGSQYLLGLAIFTANGSDNYVAGLRSITINYCCFHFLQNSTISCELIPDHIKSKYTQLRNRITMNMLTLSSLIFISFISSCNLSAATVFPPGSLTPEAGARLTEAIQ